MLARKTSTPTQPRQAVAARQEHVCEERHKLQRLGPCVALNICKRKDFPSRTYVSQMPARTFTPFLHPRGTKLRAIHRNSLTQRTQEKLDCDGRASGGLLHPLEAVRLIRRHRIQRVSSKRHRLTQAATGGSGQSTKAHFLPPHTRHCPQHRAHFSTLL